ncbi:MAG: GTPase Era, partial [Planctomycetaceae bacterium]
MTTRAGYVALVGKPNVGKSTLLNAFTGEKLSIVSVRAQTTRERVMGIWTGEDRQMVFVDTPGLLEPRYLLQHSMLQAARTAVSDSDVVLLLLDGTDPDASLPDEAATALLRRRAGVLVVAVNKTDVAAAADVAALRSAASDRFDADAFEVSATSGAGVVALRDALGNALPLSPFLYPEDDLAVQPVRFFVAELVRETVFEEYA